MAFEYLAAKSICGFAKLVTGVRAVWRGSAPNRKQRVYFANHRSHGDFVLIWASLPPYLRELTRPVAGADYWLKNGLRRFIINRVFRGLLIGRAGCPSQGDPIELMGSALSYGDSLILFPEGTRNQGEDLLPFKSGIYHLAKRYPEIEFIPVWIENLGRVMPKGSFVPVPLLCSLTFGSPITFIAEETKEDFLLRARTGLLSLAPPHD